MRHFGLKIQQRVTYKVTTQPKHCDAVANDLLNRRFDSVAPNHIWAGDITYLRTCEGWLYLAVVMDFTLGVSSDGPLTSERLGPSSAVN